LVPIRLQVLRRDCDGLGQLERGSCDSRDIGKPPVLVMGGRKPYLAETREGVLAEFSQPWEVLARSTLLEFSEALQIKFDILNCRGQIVFPD